MRVYAVLSLLLSLAMIVLGIAMLVRTFAGSGGSVGIILGTLFIAAGAGRLYVMGRS